PAGENPPPGAILDYYVPTGAGPVTVEVLDSAKRVLRTYSSSEPLRSPDPAVDPAAYNRVCQETPNAAGCGPPLYWPAPPMIVSAAPGMHRIWWDMHYDPIPGEAGGRGGGGAAVPHRTYPSVATPWVSPGNYTVRLTTGGKTSSQPISLRLDPRV